MSRFYIVFANIYTFLIIFETITQFVYTALSHISIRTRKRK